MYTYKEKQMHELYIYVTCDLFLLKFMTSKIVLPAFTNTMNDIMV